MEDLRNNGKIELSNDLDQQRQNQGQNESTLGPAMWKKSNQANNYCDNNDNQWKTTS